MPKIEFEERDFLRGKVVEPAWYRTRIESAGESLSKDGGSTNYPMESTILFNGDTGSTEFQGVPIEWNFNSKLKRAIIGFLECMGADPKPGRTIELGNAAGKEIDIFIENDTYQGRIVNRVNHKYRVPKPEVKAVSQ